MRHATSHFAGVMPGAKLHCALQQAIAVHLFGGVNLPKLGPRVNRCGSFFCMNGGDGGTGEDSTPVETHPPWDFQNRPFSGNEGQVMS
jgi:hypothetical protein